LLDRWVPEEERRAAVELGCGTGGFLETLCRRFGAVAAVDAYADSLRAAPHLPNLETAQADVLAAPLADAAFDLVAALDVLEHVPPEAFLAEAARLARPGGWLLLTVPAGPSLWSALDVAAGHRCRYTLARLRDELRGTGWRIVHWTHYQLLLWPLVWASRRFFARAGRDRSPLERRPPAALGRLLGAVNSLEVRALGRLRLPLGSSLVTLAHRSP
jgi:SAM-dependent methyltransferase